MLDFTQGASWFAAGFSTTLVLVLLMVVFVFFARRTEHR
jgi:preprotein translocase subunit YajC